MFDGQPSNKTHLENILSPQVVVKKYSETLKAVKTSYSTFTRYLRIISKMHLKYIKIKYS